MKPNVGMVYPVCAPVATYTPGTSITYSAGSVVSEARSASISWDRADGEFYGDDVLLDSDNGVLGYTIDFEPAGLKDTIRATLLGEVAGDGTTEYSVTDAAAPYVGFGYVRVMRDNATGTVVTNYEAWWYYRVQFSVNSEETRTKERNIEWRVPTLNGRGTGVQLGSGDTLTFAVHKTFASMSDAKTWLNSKASIT